MLFPREKWDNSLIKMWNFHVRVLMENTFVITDIFFTMFICKMNIYPLTCRSASCLSDFGSTVTKNLFTLLHSWTFCTLPLTSTFNLPARTCCAAGGANRNLRIALRGTDRSISSQISGQSRGAMTSVSPVWTGLTGAESAVCKKSSCFITITYYVLYFSLSQLPWRKESGTLCFMWSLICGIHLELELGSKLDLYRMRPVQTANSKQRGLPVDTRASGRSLRHFYW